MIKKLQSNEIRAKRVSRKKPRLTGRTVVIIFIVAAVLTAVTAAVICVLAAGSGHKADKREYSDAVLRASPDGGHIISIREWRCGGATGADIYYRPVGDGRAKNTLVSTEHFENGALPVSDGDFRIEWNDDSVTVRLRSHAQGETDDDSTWRAVKYSFGSAGTTSGTDKDGNALY